MTIASANPKDGSSVASTLPDATVRANSITRSRPATLGGMTTRPPNPTVAPSVANTLPDAIAGANPISVARPAPLGGMTTPCANPNGNPSVAILKRAAGHSHSDSQPVPACAIFGDDHFEFDAHPVHVVASQTAVAQLPSSDALVQPQGAALGRDPTARLPSLRALRASRPPYQRGRDRQVRGAGSVELVADRPSPVYKGRLLLTRRNSQPARLAP